MNPISAILHKEWTDLRQDKMILLGTVIPTAVLTTLPLLGAWVATHFSDGEAPSAVKRNRTRTSRVPSSAVDAWSSVDAP